jgi:hypothetical protein
LDLPPVMECILPSPTTIIPDNWALTWPVQVGDQVEADLGGCFFPATVTNIVHNNNNLDSALYDVLFFDGDKEMGLQRQQLKLMNQPRPSSNPTISERSQVQQPDVSTMTAKELKRWNKEQAKFRKKKK